MVECNTTNVAASFTLNQGGRSREFTSRFLQGSKLHYPAIEKETIAIIESTRKRSHFLHRQFCIPITDQQSIGFRYDSRR